MKETIKTESKILLKNIAKSVLTFLSALLGALLGGGI